MKPLGFAVIILGVTLIFHVVMTVTALSRHGHDRYVRMLETFTSSNQVTETFGYSENGSNVVLWTTQHPLR